MQALIKSNSRREVQKKQYKSYERDLKETSEMVREKLELGRQRFTE